MSSKFADNLDSGWRHVARVSAGLDAGNAHLGVTSTGPMNQQHGLVSHIIEITDDLLDQDMDETPLGPRIA
jgi:hypothetical protein